MQNAYQILIHASGFRYRSVHRGSESTAIRLTNCYLLELLTRKIVMRFDCKNKFANSWKLFEQINSIETSWSQLHLDPKWTGEKPVRLNGRIKLLKKNMKWQFYRPISIKLLTGSSLSTRTGESISIDCRRPIWGFEASGPVVERLVVHLLRNLPLIMSQRIRNRHVARNENSPNWRVGCRRRWRPRLPKLEFAFCKSWRSSRGVNHWTLWFYKSQRRLEILYVSSTFSSSLRI